MSEKDDRDARERPEAADLDVPAEEGGTLPADPDEGPRRARGKGDVARAVQPPSPSITRPPDPDSDVPTSADRDAED